MTTLIETEWARLAPPLRSRWMRTRFLKHARALVRANIDSAEFDKRMAETRRTLVASLTTSRGRERYLLLAAGLLLSDLRLQGWLCRIRGGNVEVRPPDRLTAD